MRRCGHGAPQCESCRVAADTIIDAFLARCFAADVAAEEAAILRATPLIGTVSGATARYRRR